MGLTRVRVVASLTAEPGSAVKVALFSIITGASSNTSGSGITIIVTISSSSGSKVPISQVAVGGSNGLSSPRKPVHLLSYKFSYLASSELKEICLQTP